MRWRRRKFSPGGSQIFRHAERERPFEFAIAGDEERRETLERALVGRLGEEPQVFHEMMSDLIHIDVFVWAPEANRPWWTLVTVGMSDRPMRVPRTARRAGAPRHLELFVRAPEDADVELVAHWLRTLARVPHEYETFFAEGHTIPNGDPAEPFVDGSEMAGWMTWGPSVASGLVGQLAEAPEPVGLLGVTPLSPPEIAHKLEAGAEDLVLRLEQGGIELDMMSLGRRSLIDATG